MLILEFPDVDGGMLLVPGLAHLADSILIKTKSFSSLTSRW